MTSTKLLAAASITMAALLPLANAQENFCGSSWVDAVSSCTRPCPTGAPSGCDAGETCFANTPCVRQTVTVRPTPRPTAPLVPPAVAQQINNNGNGGQQYQAANTQWGSAASGGTCGNGQRGNGQCPLPSECCSRYGHCGTSPEHCSDPRLGASPPSTGGAAPSIFGTCGGGQVGNAICPNNAECCSQYGFCGTAPEHCVGKAGNLGPDYPSGAGAQTTPQFNQQGVLVPAPAPPQQQQQSSPQVFGTCGGANVGNGICPVNAECCSKHGFCGTSLEHCTNKVGPDMPGQPLSAPTATQQQFGGQQQQQQQQFSGQPQNQQQFGGQTQNQQQFGGQTQSQQPQFGSQQQQPQQAAPNNYNAPVPPHGTSKKIIGYYAGWQWYDRDKLAKPSNMDFSKVQRVNYAFFQPDPLGNIFGTDRWGDPQLLFGPYSSIMAGGRQKCSYDGPGEVNCAYHEHNSGLIYMAHQAGAEVYPSIGGWTLSDHFPTLSANPQARDAFAKKCVEILTYHEFDGIDIDWEYPGYTDHSGTPQDKENFTKMLAAIKAELDKLTMMTGKSYGLTAALPCSPDNIKNIEVEKITSILTEFNLMSYDFHGSWDAVTGMNAPLYYQGYGNEEFNIHRCVENYVALGVERGKINIGLPFYGRSFKFANAMNQEHGGNDLANWPEDDGTPQFFNVWNKLPHMRQMRDNKSKTQFAYISHQEQQQAAGLNNNNVDALAQSLPEGLVSFDDERAICDKVHYAQMRNLGGFIIWELSGDVLNDLQTPLLDITNRKLGNPSLKCCMLHSADECEKERLEDERNQQLAHSQMGGFDSARWASSPMVNNGLRQRNNGSCYFMLLLSLVLIAAV